MSRPRSTRASWRDQTYPARNGQETPDPRRPAGRRRSSDRQNPGPRHQGHDHPRSIGMAAAGLHLDKAAYDSLFAKLQIEADKIQHPPSHAIALTYIAMSQAFAGDNAGAMKTANAMERNSALRNKAHNEAAKIRADRGEFDAALASIKAIPTTPPSATRPITPSRRFSLTTKNSMKPWVPPIKSLTPTSMLRLFCIYTRNRLCLMKWCPIMIPCAVTPTDARERSNHDPL